MTMNGIDISNWQAGINIPATNASFVITKATEGTGYISPDFKRQAEQTLASGKLLGIYHFMSTEDPIKQADFFINNIQPYIGKALLVLDFEAEAVNMGASHAKAFLDRVKSKTGVAPLIYMSSSVTHQFDWSSVASSYGLWAAQYATNDATGWQANPWTDGKGYGAWKSPAIYQYTSNLRIDGYSGPLDGNIAYMDKTAWNKYANSQGANIPTPQPSAPKPPTSSPSHTGKTLEQLANEVQKGVWGDGEGRNRLGLLKVGVQAIVNQRLGEYSANKTVDILAQETMRGNYGNGDDRKRNLGSYYNAVQNKINGASSQTQRTYTVVPGDTLSGIGIKLGVNWKDLAAKNNIGDPNKISVGQVLKY